MRLFFFLLHSIFWMHLFCNFLTNVLASPFVAETTLILSTDMTTGYDAEVYMPTESVLATGTLQDFSTRIVDLTTSVTEDNISSQEKNTTVGSTCKSEDIEHSIVSFTTVKENNPTFTVESNSIINSTTDINDGASFTPSSISTNSSSMNSTTSRVFDINTTTSSTTVKESKRSFTTVINNTTTSSTTDTNDGTSSISSIINKTSSNINVVTSPAIDINTSSSSTISSSTKDYTVGTSSTVGLPARISPTKHIKVIENTVETQTPEPWKPQCGQVFKRKPLVVGGINSKAGEFPWAVSVRVLTTHFCGGTIINKDWILTAAHCVNRFAARYYRIRLGGHDVDIDEFRPKWDLHVSKVILHPKFGSPARYSYDIALLKLARSIDYREFAAPVCLPENVEETYEGWNVTVVGWGQKNESVQAKAKILQKAVIPVIDNDVCAQWYSEVHYGYIRVRDFHICAGERYGGKDSCKGDSGGPLIVKDSQNRSTLVGVVSAGIGCGRSELPGVYSRVTYFVPWIMKITGGYTHWPEPKRYRPEMWSYLLPLII